MSKRKSRVNRKESGAISTLALFTVLMFLAILMGSYLITSTLLKSQMKSNLRIEQIYGQEVDKVDEIYEELAKTKNKDLARLYSDIGTLYKEKEISGCDNAIFSINDTVFESSVFKLFINLSLAGVL